MRFKNFGEKDDVNKNIKSKTATLKQLNERSNRLRFEKEISKKYKVQVKLDTLSKQYSIEYDSLIGDNLMIKEYILLDVYKDTNGLESMDVIVRYDEILPLYIKLTEGVRAQLDSFKHGYIVFKLLSIKKSYQPLNLEDEYGELESKKANFIAQGELITIVNHNK